MGAWPILRRAGDQNAQTMRKASYPTKVFLIQYWFPLYNWIYLVNIVQSLKKGGWVKANRQKSIPS